MKKITVVTPVYYNQETLYEHSGALSKQRDLLRQKYSVDLELIYVNDGSGDNSLKILEEIQNDNPSWITLISLTRNFGAMSAVNAGLSYIKGDAFSVLAADMQDPPELLENLTNCWLQGSKFSLCARKKRNDPWLKKTLAKIFYKLVLTRIIVDYPANGFDFFLMDKQYLSNLNKKGKNFNLGMFAFWLGVQPEFVFYDRQERKHGSSKWTYKKQIKLLLDSVIGFTTFPIKIATTVGLLTSLLSFCYCFFIMVSSAIGNIPIPGYATIVCLISLLLGLVLFILGIIAEYLTRIYDEVNQKPEYVIDKIYFSSENTFYHEKTSSLLNK